MTPTRTAWLAAALLTTGCLDSDDGGIFKGDDVDITGNYTLSHDASWRVTVADEVVLNQAPATGTTIDIDGTELSLDVLCEAPSLTCPLDAQWFSVGLDKPFGSGHVIVNLVNLDPDAIDEGTRLGGFVEGTDLTLALGAHHLRDTGCEDMTREVEVEINEDTLKLRQGSITTTYPAGCTIAGVELTREVVIETGFTGTRVQDLDLEDVEEVDEGPVDGEGDPIN